MEGEFLASNNEDTTTFEDGHVAAASGVESRDYVHMDYI